MERVVTAKKNIQAALTVPGDKSISHRAVMFSAIADGVSEITGFLTGEDCLSTIRCFRQLGVSIELAKDRVLVYGKGKNGLQRPKQPLNAGNSGTTIRLMAGLLAGQPFASEITGDASIQKRPMDRVISPLSLMGADIKGRKNPGFAPLLIQGRRLTGITYHLPVASAQVKSAVLLASLYADGVTEIIEPAPTRDHTETMLRFLGAPVETRDGCIRSGPVERLSAQSIAVPGDISSAAFWLVAALLCENARIRIQNVGVNGTRTGIIDALNQMGARISIQNQRVQCGESVADLTAETSALKGITIEGALIPRLIDEIPVLAVAALFAEGQTIIKDAAELKVKESNRIRTMVTELGKLGAGITETADGMVIQGKRPLKGARVCSHNDHRVAMSLAVAALKAAGETVIEGAECVDISYPGFFEALDAVDRQGIY